MAKKITCPTYLPLVLLLSCWLPASTASAQVITLDRMPASIVNQPNFDLYDLRRPALSLTGFDNTEAGYDPAYGLGLKQVLDRRYNQNDMLVSPVFDRIIDIAHAEQRDPYGVPFGPDRRIRLDRNTNILQSRAFEALVTFVLERNGYDPTGSDFGLRSHEDAMAALKQAFVNPAGGVLIAGEQLIEDYVKYPRSIDNVARAIDLYLALENAYFQFPAEVDFTLLMSLEERSAVFGEFGLALLTPDFVLTTLAIDVYADEIDLPPEEKERLLELLRQLPEGDNTVEEVESGNWAMKQRLGIGYGSLAMQAIPGSGEEALLAALLPKARRSADLTSAESYDRFRHWNFMTFGGKRFWAESPYYLDFALEQVLPYWHALRANGLLESTPDPFFNPVLLNPIEWLADTVTPDGRILPLDDGNRAPTRHCGLMRWDGGYGDANLGKKCAWIDEVLGGPGHRDEILLMEIAIPRTDVEEAPAGFIGNDPGPLIPHASEQQLIRRFKSPDNAAHFVALNGEHGMAVDRGEGHEQPDQQQLLYYVDELSYLLDSGYDRAGTVDNSSWNHYYDHNTMTLGGEGGLFPPELRILEVRKASEPDLMGEVAALHAEQHGNITILHGEQRLRTESESDYKTDYTRDVLFIEDATPYLIDINRIRHEASPSECEWNAFKMNYHVNSDDASIPAGYTPSGDGFMRWDNIQGEPGTYLHAFPMSVEFDLAAEHVQIVPDEVLESELGPVKTPVDIARLTIYNPDRCKPFWSLATVFQAGDSPQADGDRPELLWNYSNAMHRQGWVWPRNATTYDVFVARSANRDSEILAFDLREANPGFPNVNMQLPREAAFGFARVTSTSEGWEVEPGYQVNLEKIGENPGVQVAGDDPFGEAATKGVPAKYALRDAFPNPFNPSATIRFELPEKAQVRLIVYDMLGREVKRLVDGFREAGVHEVDFDASGLPTGVYLYRLETPEGGFMRRMVLVK